MASDSKVALITGGARGIGRSIGLRLAREGVRIAVGDLLAEEGQQTVKDVQEAGSDAMFTMLNVTDEESAKSAVDQVVERWGRVDILVNNAGITRDKLLLRLGVQDWDAVLTVNLKGAYICSRAVLPVMLRQRWGRIVGISSVVGLVGNPGQTNYAASKAGLIGFTKALAREVAGRNITVNAVAPGYISTHMVQSLSEELQQAVLKQIPVSRFGTTEDVANAVAFLCSEDSSYITGHVLNVDGGLAM